jgi:hypothetical protein
LIVGVYSSLPHSAPSPMTTSSRENASAAPLFGTPASNKSASARKKQVLYVTASTLKVRAQPNSAAAVLLTVTRGTSVAAISQIDGWAEVQLNNGASGWMSTRYLSPAKPQEPAQVIEGPPKKPASDRSAIVRAIIAESIESYPDNCPCPYNTDHAGRSCGRRSAWSKAGGCAPLCYPDDVTAQMISDYSARH